MRFGKIPYGRMYQKTHLVLLSFEKFFGSMVARVEYYMENI